MIRELSFGGELGIQKHGLRRAPLAWKLKNSLRWPFLRGWLAYNVVRPLASAFGICTLLGELRLVHTDKTGAKTDYGVVGYRVITNAGVTFLRDDFNNGAQDVSTFNFHGCGTGTTAEAAGDTALVTESTTALNPDSTRATGSRSTPASNQFASAGTLTFDASAAVTEHGLFSSSGTGTGTLWDRTVFSAVNVVSGESITFTYTLTLTAGG